MADYLSFETIYQTVMKAIGDSQYARSDEVKAICNQVYLNEILVCDDLYPPFWLMECDDTMKSKARATITGITKASPPVVTATAHGFVDGDLVTIYDVVGMTELNYRTFVVDQVSADTFHLHDYSLTDIVGAGYTTYTSGGYAHHRGVTLTDTQKVLWANWHGYNKGMEFISPQQVEDQATWMDVSCSRPLKMMHKQVYTAAGAQIDYLLWYQAADAAYNLRVWYVKQAARLSATTDVPLLPYQFHDAIVAGAITRLGENKVQVESGVVWPTIYNAEIEAIKAFNRKWWMDHKPYERSGLFLP
jgi:hypothetical protein